ncbi:MAG: hypothetical protein ACREDI_09245, partial [Roseiarcus sp.]
MPKLPLKGSIGKKIFGAFLAMGLMTGLLGAYGLYVLAAAGDIVVDTYDRPLMAINYARSANLIFAEMDKEALRGALIPEQERPELEQGIDRLAVTFFDDLAVADQRSLGADERKVI